MSTLKIDSPEGQELKIRLETKTHIMASDHTDDDGNPIAPITAWRLDRVDVIPAGQESREYDISPKQRLIVEGK